MALSRFVLPFADVGPGIKPASGAQLFFFETGTSNNKNTFNCPDGTTANSNPVIADSNGVFPDIFAAGNYKVILKDKNGIQIWEADPVSSPAANAGVEFASVSEMLASEAVQNLDDGTIITTKSFNTVVTTEWKKLAADPGGVFVLTGINSFLALSSDNGHIGNFGAFIDGSTNDSSFVSTAGSFGKIYNPGSSKLNDVVFVNNVQCSLFGDIGKSKFIGAAIEFAVDDDEQFISIKDINFEPTGNAIRYVGTGQAVLGIIQDRLKPRLVIEDVFVNNKVGSASSSIILTDLIHGVIERVHCIQPDGVTTGVAIAIDGANRPVEININNCWVFNYDTGIRSIDAEGVKINECTLVAINTGVSSPNTTSKPDITIVNTHINALIKCIDLRNVDNPTISNNSLFRRSNAAINNIAINLNGCSKGTVTGNTVTAGTWQHVVLTDSDNINIDGNTFTSFSDAIVANAGTSDCKASDNIYATAGVKVVDAGDNEFNTDSFLSCSLEAITTTTSYAQSDITEIASTIEGFTITAGTITFTRNITCDLFVSVNGDVDTMDFETRVNGAYKRLWPTASGGGVISSSSKVMFESGDTLDVFIKSASAGNVIFDAKSTLYIIE